MGSKILSFVLGILVGGGVVGAILYKKTAPESGTTVASEDGNAAAANKKKIMELESKVAALQEQLTETHNTNERLANRTQELMVKAATPAEEKPLSGLAALFGGAGGGTNNPFSELFSEGIKTSMEEELANKLETLKTNLNLTAEQQVGVSNILAAEGTKASELIQKMFKGELSAEEMAKLGSEFETGEQDQIKALLTADQLKTYEEYQANKKETSAHDTAESETDEMQSSLKLTPEQKEKVYAILYEQAKSNPFDNSYNPGDFRKQFEERKTALSAVLTPDQLSRYVKQQELQVKMIEAFLPGANKADAKITVKPAK